MEEKQRAIQAIEAHADLIARTAEEIWAHPELSLRETFAAALYEKNMRELGFRVETGICGIPTAFAAHFGAGRPHIGILAEYDALSDLSQTAGALAPEALVPGGCGHGCGHHLLGAGALAAAIGVKAFLEESGLAGTVTLYGCPGEEGCASKAFMAREGLWRQLDAALTWHPEDCNQVITGGSSACIQVQYLFHGTAAHAAGDPERGRSALDAVELMNVAVQFLREHMPPDARIHYAITDAGGVSPNVVQGRASVLYMVRSAHVREASALQKRVDDIAKGAALMTSTRFERRFIDALSDTVPNHALEALLHENFKALGVPSHTPEELAFAKALSETYDGAESVPGIAARWDAAYAKDAAALRGDAAMNDFLLPLYTGYAFRPGSTDVGDVSWQCPTAQISVASWPNGCPGHSWQIVSCGGTAMAHRGAIHAGKVLSAAAVDLYSRPELLSAARREFQERTAEGYVCPIPPEAVPMVPA